MEGEVVFMHPCIFHERFFTQNKQGGMKMTSPPMATSGLSVSSSSRGGLRAVRPT
jgi:hypothetical protein